MVRHTLNLQNGKATMKLLIRFDSAAHVEDFCRLSAEAMRAEKRMKELGTDEDCDRYGRAIMALYSLVLGEEAARSVEAWFGPNVLGMVYQINPILRDKVMPDVQKCSVIARKRKEREFRKQQKRAMKHASK